MGLFKRITADKQEQSVTTKQQIGTSLSHRDSIEKLNLMEHSFNALTHAGVQTVGELLKLVESGKLRAIHGLRSTSILEIEVKLAQLEMVDNSEVEANPDATPDQNDVPLSQEDTTEEPSLPQYSPNPLIHTESRTVGEGTQHVESAEIQTISEVEANPDATPDQNSVSLSREDSIERLSLTRHTLNLLKHTDIRTVGDLLRWVESGRLQTIPALGRISILEIEDELTRINSLDDSGVEANLGAAPDQNDAPVSQEDSTEEPSMTEHSPNPHIHTESQTVGEDTQQIESSELQTIIKSEADTNETLDQNDPPLSRKDSTEKIRLTRDALNRLKHTDVRTVGQLLQWVESGKSQTTAEAEADTNETPDQNDVSPSREDATEEQSLTQHSPNPLIDTDSQVVGEVTQQIESGEISTIAEGEVNVDAIPGQNDISLSQEDSTEEPSLPQRSPSPLKDTDSQTVGEAAQQVESDEILTIAEGTANANVTLDQNDAPLSREDPIEKLRLTQYALNRLKQTDIRTVGELLQWVESDTTPALGQKSISKIKERLAQANTLNHSETEADTNTTSEQNDVSLSREESTEEQNLTQHPDLRTVREDGQQVESTELQTISEVEVDADAMSDQNDTHLSQGDAIEKLNLSRPSFIVLTRIGIRTVGEVLQLFESARPNMIRQAFGRKFTSEIRTKLAQVKILDNPKVEKNTDAILDQGDVSLSREDSIEKSSLTQHSPNQLHTERQTVGEGTQHVESSEIQTVSEVKANTNAALDQNDTPLSRKDPIEKLGLTHRSLNVLKHIDIQTVGELLQWVESGRLQIIHRLGPKSISEIKERLAQAKILDDSEGALNTNETSDQNDISLSREDSIERLSLTRHTRNLLKHTDIRTVGDLLQWVESGRLQTIPALGKKSILEIKDELTRVNSLDDSGVKANSGATPDQNDVSFSREDATEEPGLLQHSPNPPIQTESQTVREGTQHIESSELQTTSEVQVNTDTVPDRNDTYLSRGDAIEKLNLPHRSLKTLKRANIRTVGELSQRVELGRLQTICGLGKTSIVKIEERLAQVKIYDNYAHLSPEDDIRHLYLRSRSFKALTRAGIQTVGEVLKLVESGELRAIPYLGSTSILDIKNKLAQVQIYGNSEGEANTDAILDQNAVAPSRETFIETPSLSQHASNPLTNTDSQKVGEVTQKVESDKIPTTSEVAGNTKAIPDPNYVYLSLGDHIEQLNLTNRSFNALTRVGVKTVGETLELVESGKLRTIRGLGKTSILEITDKLVQIKSEVESLAKTGTIPDRNYLYFSLEDRIEQLNLTNRSFNALIRVGVKSVRQLLQLVESGRLQTTRGLGRESILEITTKLAQIKFEDSEGETNTTAVPNDMYFSQEDTIEKLNLSRRSFNALTRIGIRTVGQVLQLVGLVKLQTIPALGRKSISEIRDTLAQVKILDDSETESLTKKDEIPKKVMRWQAQVVSKQLSKGLLHGEAIIAEKSIKEWLAEMETIESSHVYEILAAVLGSSLNICEEIEIFLNQIPGQYRMTILLSAHGFETKTLAQTGDELGISRERVRQLRNEFKNKATSLSNLKARPVLLRMQSALLIARDLGV